MSPRRFAILIVAALWLGWGPGSVATFPHAPSGSSLRWNAPATTPTHGVILSTAKGLVHESPLAKNSGGTASIAIAAGAHPAFFSGRLAPRQGLLAVCHSLQAQGVRWQI